MLELVCRVYNINKGHNKELLERCKWLSDYMTFVDKVRECHKNHGDDRLIEDIIEAIDYCINNGILRESFETRKTEVLRMTKVDYTFERRMKLNYDEGRDDGMKLGEKMELPPVALQTCASPVQPKGPSPWHADAFEKDLAGKESV